MSLNKCRTCGDGIFVAKSKNIFIKEHQGIRNKIENLTGLTLDNNKDLPQHICSCCVLDLQHATFFRERCIKAQSLFVAETKPEPVELDEEDANDLDKTEEEVEHDERDNERDDEPHDEPDDEPGDEPDDEPDNEPDDEPDDELDVKPHDEPDDETIDEMLSDLEEDVTLKQAQLPAKYPRVLLKRLPESATKIMKLPKVNPLPLRKKRKRYVNYEKKFTCEYCGWSFRDLGNMKAHKLTHMEPEFKCDECDRKFYTRPHLNLHIRVIHKFEKPFLCKYCGEGFPNSPARCRHERTFHANELPFPCEVCPKRFISKISLEKHVKTHKEGTRVEKFACTTCNREFRDKRTLTKHYDTNYHKVRLSEYMRLEREGSLASDETIDEEFDLAENLMQGMDD